MKYEKYSIIKQSTMIIPGACDNSADSWNFIYPKRSNANTQQSHYASTILSIAFCASCA